MPVVLVAVCCVLGAMLLVIGLVLLASVRTVKRWKRTVEVSDDTQYVETLATLSASSARHQSNPYTDIEWKAPEFSITRNHPPANISSPNSSRRCAARKAKTLPALRR